MPFRYPSINWMNPWLLLQIKRNKTLAEGKRHCYSKDHLDQKIRDLRKEFLGSDFPLTFLVHNDYGPDQVSVVAFSKYLAERVAFYLGADRGTEPIDYDLAYNVFYYGLQLYAYDTVGDDCIDDLIQLANAYEKNPIILSFLLEGSVPEDIEVSCREWVMENEIAPSGFTSATTAAVAVMLGVLKDPLGATL